MCAYIHTFVWEFLYIYTHSHIYLYFTRNKFSYFVMWVFSFCTYIHTHICTHKENYYAWILVHDQIKLLFPPRIEESERKKNWKKQFCNLRANNIHQCHNFEIYRLSLLRTYRLDTGINGGWRVDGQRDNKLIVNCILVCPSLHIFCASHRQ